MIALLLFSCSAIEKQQGSGYLDDNLSDRWDLSKKRLGDKVIYVDTSNYGKIARLNNTASNPAENLKINNSIQLSLIEALDSASISGGNIAISGYSSEETYRAVVDSFKEFKGVFTQSVKILYIGNKKYKSQIKRLVESKGGIFQYANRPKTAL